MTLSARGKVRFLYKACLRLHASLPPDARQLGDVYVKDEFRRHKEVDAKAMDAFIYEWTKYVVTLSNQLGRPHTSHVGEKLSEKDLDALSDTQLHQLYELFRETTKEKA